jgi:phosphatidylinositol glycan class W
MDDDYKRAKEAFVSDTTGSSMVHINAITFAAIVSLPTFFHDAC